MAPYIQIVVEKPREKKPRRMVAVGKLGPGEAVITATEEVFEAKNAETNTR